MPMQSDFTLLLSVIRLHKYLVHRDENTIAGEQTTNGQQCTATYMHLLIRRSMLQWIHSKYGTSEFYAGQRNGMGE